MNKAEEKTKHSMKSNVKIVCIFKVWAPWERKLNSHSILCDKGNEE
jgi:hypothetical protein